MLNSSTHTTIDEVGKTKAKQDECKRVYLHLQGDCSPAPHFREVIFLPIPCCSACESESHLIFHNDFG